MKLAIVQRVQALPCTVRGLHLTAEQLRPTRPQRLLPLPVPRTTPKLHRLTVHGNSFHHSRQEEQPTLLSAPCQAIPLRIRRSITGNLSTILRSHSRDTNPAPATPRTHGFDGPCGRLSLSDHSTAHTSTPKFANAPPPHKRPRNIPTLHFPSANPSKTFLRPEGVTLQISTT